MTIICGQGVGGAEKHDAFPLTFVGKAIQRKDSEEALRLIASGYLVPFEERGLGTLQQIILNCPNPKLIEAVIARLDIQRINAFDATTDNALITAAKCRNIAVIHLLVAAKADVNLSDENQLTALHQIVNGYGNQPNQVPGATDIETIQCLLHHGASMEILDASGKTALGAYISTNLYNPTIISFLVSEGAEPPYADVQVRPPKHVLQLTAAIQAGLEQRRNAVSKALDSKIFPLELLTLINKYV